MLFSTSVKSFEELEQELFHDIVDVDLFDPITTTSLVQKVPLRKRIPYADAILNGIGKIAKPVGYALLAGSIAGYAGASHEPCLKESLNGVQCAIESPDILSAEGLLLSKTYHNGLDEIYGTVDDKIFLRLDQWNGAVPSSKGLTGNYQGEHNFRIETDIRENMSTLENTLEEEEYLYFHYQKDTHNIVQIDRIASKEEAIRIMQENRAATEDHVKSEYFFIGTAATVSVAGASLVGIYLWRKRKAKEVR